ncbi:hypothetical protein NQ317_013657, partial [Molorchus minor]
MYDNYLLYHIMGSVAERLKRQCSNRSYLAKDSNIRGLIQMMISYDIMPPHHNNTVIAIIFNGKNKKALDYVIRYHDESYYGGLDTSKLYLNMFQFNPGT